MRNKNLFLEKLNRIEGKLKSIEVLMTRPSTTIQQMKENLQYCYDQINDLESMIEREEEKYN